MALRLSAKMVGLDEAKRRLAGLPKTIRNRAIRSAFRQMGSALSKDVKSQLPAKRAGTSGQTRKSIGFKVKLARVSGKIVLIVGPRSGFGRFVAAKPTHVARYHVPTRIFHILEFGSNKFQGRGYLAKALARNRSQLPVIMRQNVNRVLSEYGNR